MVVWGWTGRAKEKKRNAGAVVRSLPCFLVNKCIWVNGSRDRYKTKKLKNTFPISFNKLRFLSFYTALMLCMVKNPQITSGGSTSCGLCSPVVRICWKKLTYKWIHTVQTCSGVNCTLTYIENFQLFYW